MADRRRLDLGPEGRGPLSRGEHAAGAHLVDHVRGADRGAALELALPRGAPGERVGLRSRGGARLARDPRHVELERVSLAEPERQRQRRQRHRRQREQQRAGDDASDKPPAGLLVVHGTPMLGWAAVVTRRRTWIGIGLATIAAAALVAVPAAAAKAKGFELGVAAGDVTSSSAILWAKAKRQRQGRAPDQRPGRVRRLRSQARRQPRAEGEAGQRQHGPEARQAASSPDTDLPLPLLHEGRRASPTPASSPPRRPRSPSRRSASGSQAIRTRGPSPARRSPTGTTSRSGTRSASSATTSTC